MKYLCVIVVPGAECVEILTTAVEAPSAKRACELVVRDVVYYSVAVLDRGGRVLYFKADGRRA